MTVDQIAERLFTDYNLDSAGVTLQQKIRQALNHAFLEGKASRDQEVRDLKNAIDSVNTDRYELRETIHRNEEAHGAAMQAAMEVVRECTALKVEVTQLKQMLAASRPDPR